MKKNLFLPPVCRGLIIFDKLMNGAENQTVYKKIKHNKKWEQEKD